jgi:hypothetical protein
MIISEINIPTDVKDAQRYLTGLPTSDPFEFQLKEPEPSESFRMDVVAVTG